MKKRIFLCIDWFHPAFKAGGPIRSAVNFVDQFHDVYEIYVWTSAYDLGETTPLSNVKTDQWCDLEGKAKIFYATIAQLNYAALLKQIQDVAPDHIYLQSFFSKTCTIYPLWMKWRGAISQKIVLAPRGMLKESALSFKPVKKKVFLFLFKLMGLQKKIRFQATDAQEAKDILQYFPQADMVLAPNLPGRMASHPYPIIKTEGTVKILFVGRVHPIKNLLFLLKSLRAVKGDVVLSIIGVKEDEAYWKECEQSISALPSTIKVQFMGERSHDQILQQFERHHIFALPTRGENFGHAIFEALSNGRPVIISDQTPWKGLAEKNAGWDLSLDRSDSFSEAIQCAIDWKQEAFDRYASGALRLSTDFRMNSDDIKNYHLLFN